MSRYALRIWVLPLTVSVLPGCPGPDHSASTWASRGDSTEFRPVTRAPEVCTSCIGVEPVLFLGDTAGPGSLDVAGLNVLRDSSGNYWLNQPQGLLVFSPTGGFVRRVGRAGGGPLEFQAIPLPVHTDAQGRVHIFDVVNLRETVVGRDFQIFEERRLPAAVREAVPLAGGHRYVVNAWIGDPDRIGLPLHGIDGPDVLYSFGVSTEQESIQTEPFSRRAIAIDRQGHVFSARYYDYEFEAWTSAGMRITGFRGLPLNATPVRAGLFTVDNPPPNRIFAIRVQDPALLWVISWQRKAGWRDSMVERPDRSGLVSLDMKDGAAYESMFYSRIDVIDLNTASIIATREGDEMFAGFLGPDLVFGDQHRADGIPQVGIWRVVLR